MGAIYEDATRRYVTFAETTRTALVNKLRDELVTYAGWTSISGSATTPADWVIESGATPNGDKIRLRIWDPNSGNCARLSLRNLSNSVNHDSTPMFLLPSASTRVLIADKNGFDTWLDGDTTTARSYIGCYVPQRFTFQTDPGSLGVIVSNANSDADTTYRESFRNRLRVAGGHQVVMGNTGYANGAPGAGVYHGAPQFATYASPDDVGLNNVILQWDNLDFIGYDPWISFSLTNKEATANDAHLRGQVINRMIISAERVPETTFNFDGYVWLNVTHSGTGSSGLRQGGGLWVVKQATSP